MWGWRWIGVVVATFVTACCAQDLMKAKLVIKPEGTSLSRPAKEGFVLTCEGQSDRPELFKEMKWIGPKGDLSIQEDSERRPVKKDNNLYLTFFDPSTEDSGPYNCTALYDNTDQLSASVQIIFYLDITWKQCPLQQALVINQEGNIHCEVTANPPASVSWLKDDAPLTSDRYSTDGNGITIPNVQKEDAGKYSVRAMVTLTGRLQDRVITVEVHVPPRIIHLDEIDKAVEGEEKRLTCQADGVPSPNYVWYDQDRRDLSQEDGYIVDQYAGVLTIRKVRKEDKGFYTCVARNSAGENERKLDLTVVVKPKITEFNNITTLQDEEARLECRATGDPRPNMTIRKNGKDQPFTPGTPGINLEPRDDGEEKVLTLRIYQTSRSDDGLYYCAASNEGDHVERVGHLTVEFAPTLSAMPSTVVKTWNGNPINLTCIAEAIPNATIQWWYEGQEVKSSDPFYTIFGQSSYSSLLVKPSLDIPGSDRVYGTYKCQATNSHGNGFIEIQLQQAYEPEKLLQIKFERVTPTTITFDFVGPVNDGGLPVRSFLVEYREDTQPIDEAQHHEWSEGTPYILENLKPRVGYHFRFAAKNDVGTGTWSEEKKLIMPVEAPPEAPKFMTPGGNISRYPDSFTVRWSVPLDNGEPINFFELCYVEVERKPNDDYERVGKMVKKNITTWENTARYEITGLKPNSYYKVEVRAHNSVGFSVDATLVFRTAKGSVARGITGEDDQEAGFPVEGIIAIVVVLVLVILVILDITCYFRYQWGLLFLMRHTLCGKAPGGKGKEVATEEGKGGKVADVEEKPKTEVDNPAFDKEKDPLQVQDKKTNKPTDGDVATEETPMIDSFGGKDGKGGDHNSMGDMKNQSPKGSKTSLTKNSAV